MGLVDDTDTLAVVLDGADGTVDVVLLDVTATVGSVADSVADSEFEGGASLSLKVLHIWLRQTSLGASKDCMLN